MEWVFDRVTQYANKSGIMDRQGSMTYGALQEISDQLAQYYLVPAAPDKGERIALLLPPQIPFVLSQWAVWKSGHVTVPLCPSHPVSEWRHSLTEVEVQYLIVAEEFFDEIQPLCEELGLKVFIWEELNGDLIFKPKEEQVAHPLPTLDFEDAAQILFTSGTTGKPKGVVSTHGNLHFQYQCLSEAWGWRDEDRILNVLPLHHTHGLVNVLGTCLYNGATCFLENGFNAQDVWEGLSEHRITVFMAVPTIYKKMVDRWREVDSDIQIKWTNGLENIRLMVSGSAALPINLFESWKGITQHILLERYGMTEIGMAISNPLSGIRKPGTVGQPLPGVKMELRNEENETISQDEVPGQIYIQSPALFKEYYGRPKETADGFDKSWFKTGDVAQWEDGYIRILGRKNIDIIKSGGYKISALEIENILREHEKVDDCAVVGIEDEQWGEKICVAIVGGEPVEVLAFKEWCKDLMADYKVPKEFIWVNQLPRNAMGKVIKPEVKSLFQNLH